MKVQDSILLRLLFTDQGWFMQAQEILKEVKDSGLVSTGFWYVYSLVVTSLLVTLIVSIIYLVKSFLTKFQTDIKETHSQFAKSIEMLTRTTTDLHLMVELHENEFKHIKEDINDLKDRPKKRS